MSTELATAVVKGRMKLRSLADLDRRTGAAKAAFTLRDEIIGDLGGPAGLTAMRRVLVDHVATLAAALADLAARFLAGEDVDMTQYATLANAQRRLLGDLGLERRAAEVHEHLASYLATKSRQDVGPGAQ